MRTLLLAGCSALIALAACSSSQSGKSEGDTAVVTPAKPRIGLANRDSLAAARRMHSANVVRVIGTIVSVAPVASGGMAGGPCAKTPCLANVRVDSVFDHDRDVPVFLTVGQVVPIRFAYTLAPSREFFPKMERAYPGLAVGSAFEADVIRIARKNGSSGSSGDAGELSVGDYIAR